MTVSAIIPCFNAETTIERAIVSVVSQTIPVCEIIVVNDGSTEAAGRLLEGLKSKFGDFFLIPEGGTNALAIKGCQEILTDEDREFNYICCVVGTGGTISGIINSAFPHQKVLGFPALKGDFLQDEIRIFVQNKNWELITEYHFGGYGKINEDLIRFMNQFYNDTQIPLDPIYTGKMVFGVIDLIQKNYFPAQSNILLIHTGGLQGIQGMNVKLKNKQLPTIAIDV